MADQKTRSIKRTLRSVDPLSRLVSNRGLIDDLPVEKRKWFVPLDPATRLRPGDTAADPTRIPQADASRLLNGFVRFVADIPPNAGLDLVWEHNPNELWVDAGSIDLACSPGILVVGLSVSCDEIGKPLHVTVPFAVGQPNAPRGLLMSTIDRLQAPPLIADIWSDAISAFCWEALLELATRVSAQMGKDASGLPLVPSAIAADTGLLIVQPAARHDLAGLSG